MIHDSWLILLFLPLLRYILQLSPNLSSVCWVSPTLRFQRSAGHSFPRLLQTLQLTMNLDSIFGAAGDGDPFEGDPVVTATLKRHMERWLQWLSLHLLCAWPKIEHFNEWWDLQFTHMIWYWLSCINTDQSGYIRSSSWLLIITRWLRGEHICHDSRFRWLNAVSAKEVLGFAGDPKGVTGDGTSPQRQLGRGVMLSQHAWTLQVLTFSAKWSCFQVIVSDPG